MQFQFKVTIGKNEFTFVEDAATHAEFFQKVSFYSSLPKEGPNGEDDLEISYRVAQGVYSYYSIVSKKANQEYKFGQSKQEPGKLFGKGWEPIYVGQNDEEGNQVSTGGGIQAPTPSIQQQASVVPTPQSNLPPVAKPAPRAAAPAPAARPAAPAANPTVTTQANNVLAKFLNN